MPGTVFTLARLKIVPTIENLYHQPMPEQVDEFSSLVRIKLQHPFPRELYSNHAGRIWIQVSFL